MKHVISFFLLLAMTPTAGAQHSLPNPSPFQQWLNKPDENMYEFQGQKVASREEALLPQLKQFLRTHKLALQQTNVDIRVKSYRHSPIGYHLSFVQTHEGIPIYGTEIKCNVAPDFAITSCIDKLVFTTTVDVDNAWEPQLKAGEKRCYVLDGKILRKAILRDRKDITQNKVFEEIWVEDGLFYSRDIGRYFAKESSYPDSLVYVYVFYPDPITSEQTIYGGPFINNNGADTAALTNARKLKTVHVKYLADSFWAENRFVIMTEQDNKQFVPANSRNDTFDFTRSQPFFDQMNALYHITNIKYHIDSLGFDSLCKYKVQVNTRGMSQDQSRFDRERNSGGQGTLFFGFNNASTRHVDDAEDADVIVHEYGHAIGYHANQNMVNTFMRKSLDEGLCDYLACSYSRDISLYNWEQLFNWDGHNEFWDGRLCYSSKTMDDLGSGQGNIYDNGEIVLGTLMDLWEELGRDTVDALLFATQYQLADNMQYGAIANMMLDADSLFYNGKNRDVLCKVFTDRKFITRNCDVSIPTMPVMGAQRVNEYVFRKHGIIQLSDGASLSYQRVMLYNAQGQLLQSWQIESGERQQVQSTTASGVYFLRLEGENGLVYHQKLVRE